MAFGDRQAMAKPQAKRKVSCYRKRGKLGGNASNKGRWKRVRVQGADGLLLTELLGKWEAFLHGAL